MTGAAPRLVLVYIFHAASGAGTTDSTRELLAEGNRIQRGIHGFGLGFDAQHLPSGIELALVDMHILAYPATRGTPNTS